MKRAGILRATGYAGLIGTALALGYTLRSLEETPQGVSLPAALESFTREGISVTPLELPMSEWSAWEIHGTQGGPSQIAYQQVDSDYVVIGDLLGPGGESIGQGALHQALIQRTRFSSLAITATWLTASQHPAEPDSYLIASPEFMASLPPDHPAWQALTQPNSTVRLLLVPASSPEPLANLEKIFEYTRTASSNEYIAYQQIAELIRKPTLPTVSRDAFSAMTRNINLAAQLGLNSPSVITSSADGGVTTVGFEDWIDKLHKPLPNNQ